MPWLESLWQDVRLSVRGLLRTPGITAAALLALALGIGANTALVSVASATLWRELPFRDPDRLVLVSQEGPGGFMFPGPVTRTALQEWRRRSQTFSGIVGMSHTWRNLTAPGPPELARVCFVTANYLEVTGAKLIAGRGFREEEARREDRVALISERLFRERFGSDPVGLKRGVVLEGRRYAVIGVAPRRFAIYGDWDIWLPMEFRPTPETHGTSNIRALGRLAPGIAPERAERELKSIVDDLAHAKTGVHANWVIHLYPLRIDRLRMMEILEALRVLGLLVVFVLLIACADVAGLLLARAAARERDLALRAVLGAGRARLVRRQLTETLLLFLTGGLLGLLLALWATPVLASLSPHPLPDAGVRADGRILLFTLSVSVGTGLLFGLIPALAVVRRRLAEAVQDGKRLAGTPGRRLLRDALVTGQVALTLVLAVTAGLLLQSFDRLREVHPGFEPDGVLSAKFRLARAPSDSPVLRTARYDRILRSLEKVPGVQAAALVDWLPFDQDQAVLPFRIEGRPGSPAGRHEDALARTISPGYFRTIGIPLVRGRDFHAADGPGAPPVVVINQTLAVQGWPGEDPVGKGLQLGGSTVTVVGVAQDTRQDGLAFESMPEAYFPLAQGEGRSTVLLFRAPGRAADWTEPVRKAIRSVEPTLAVEPLETLEERLAVHLAPSRFKSLMATLFALLAMFLAAIGIYGVISESVARRTHEIGIRVALGAGEWNVLGQVIREGMRPVLAGVAVGLALTLPLSRLLAHQLYEVPVRDFATYLAATAGVLCVGLVANYFPAQEATRVEPMAALREE